MSTTTFCRRRPSRMRTRKSRSKSRHGPGPMIQRQQKRGARRAQRSAEPDDYDLPVDPEQLDDNARQTIAGFTKLAHDLDLPQEGAAKCSSSRPRAQEIMAARVEQDRAEARAAKQALADEWGDDANDNLKSVNALLKSLARRSFQGVRDARTGNGLAHVWRTSLRFWQMLAEYAALKAAARLPASSMVRRTRSGSLKSKEQEWMILERTSGMASTRNSRHSRHAKPPARRRQRESGPAIEPEKPRSARP